MLLMHEGLPRSGKSYEAAAVVMMNALKDGRKIFARINGLNHEKFAELLDYDVEQVRELLIELTDEQVKDIYDHVENDALVVIDEIQDFFPNGRQKLDDKTTKFITQHGHRGLDILIMGQDLRDVHALWRRRVSQKVVFVKQEAIGRPTHYSWTLFKARTPEKFEKISSGSKKYKEKYFGLYKSHEDGTQNKGQFSDKRANLFNTKGFRYGIPAAIFAAIFAVNHLVSFFSPQDEQVKTQIDEPVKNAHSINAIDTKPIKKHPETKQVNNTQKQEKPTPPPPIDYLDEIAKTYRLRLAGIVESPKKLFAKVQALDSNYRMIEVFELHEIEALGWHVERTGYGIKIQKKAGNRLVSHVIRPWPVDPFGRVNQNQQKNLAPNGNSMVIERMKRAARIRASM